MSTPDSLPIRHFHHQSLRLGVALPNHNLYYFHFDDKRIQSYLVPHHKAVP